MKHRYRPKLGKDHIFRKFKYGKCCMSWKDKLLDKMEDSEIRQGNKHGWAEKYVNGIKL